MSKRKFKEMLKRSEVGKRFCWTIFFVFIYVFGSKISLPFVDLSKALRLNEGTTTGLQLSSAVMGGNLRGMSNLFDRSIPMDVFHDFVADVYRFKTL